MAVTIGILAHVDAGKTTLSEELLYESGAIRSKGRVDHQDAFLDTDSMEKKRGITIFSKQARFCAGGRDFILMDTPGHVDFSPEMERTLKILDAAVLIISAADGIGPQEHILWQLLQRYKVPVVVFLNKMDQFHGRQAQQDRLNGLMQQLKSAFGADFVYFDDRQLKAVDPESIAVCDDDLLEAYMEGRTQIDSETVQTLVAGRQLFPVYSGSALSGDGVPALLKALTDFLPQPSWGESFGARVYKVTRDGQGTRLTWMKITGGTLSVRDAVREPYKDSTPVLQSSMESLSGVNGNAAAGEDLEESDPEDTPDELCEDPDEEENPASSSDASRQTTIKGRFMEEKVSGIRLYSGAKFRNVTSVSAGEICAVTGLTQTFDGEGLGCEKTQEENILIPLMRCSVTTRENVDAFTLCRALQQIEEEEPMLHTGIDEKTGEINVQIMGQVQMQILTQMIEERSGLHVVFGPGSVVYKETIRRPVEGVGHFEPLRHYAEVHVVLEPAQPGTGLVFDNRCLPDMLDRNWQNLIMSSLQSIRHCGVLTGAELTDMRITLIGGRASVKHTMGGDFRKAAARAVRQGLMMAENVLLEPVLWFHLELPKEQLGRALDDIIRRSGHPDAPQFEGDRAILTGTVPYSELGDYAQEVIAYTGGEGRLATGFLDYEPCHNAREIIDAAAYDPELDRRHPTSSVFCSHGVGTIVPWYRVRDYMQVETGWTREGWGWGAEEDAHTLTDDFYTFERPDLHEAPERLGDDNGENTADSHRVKKSGKDDPFKKRQRQIEAGEAELIRIFEQTYGPIRKNLRNPENERLDALYGEESSRPKDQAGAAAIRQKQKKGSRAISQQYLLVDGYNIIFAWSELKELARQDIKAARDRLLDILSNYAGYSDQIVIVVFDAYRVPQGRGEVYRYHNIDVVFTKEAETADLYIEKTAHKLARNNRVTVATSDSVEQVIIYGSGAYRLSARGLLEEILMKEEEMRGHYLTDGE